MLPETLNATIENSVAILYGFDRTCHDGERAHPAEEEMFVYLSDYQRYLSLEHGLGFYILRATADIPYERGADIYADVCASPRFRDHPNPKFDSEQLISAFTTPAIKLASHTPALVVDKYVDRFQHVTHEGATPQALGLGIPDQYLLNNAATQDLGNDKQGTSERFFGGKRGLLLASEPATNEGLAIVSTNHTGGYISKPNGGATGKGIVRYNSYDQLATAIDCGEVPENDFIQPFIPQIGNWQGLRALHSEQASELTEISKSPDHIKEVRVHIGGHRNTEGEWSHWAEPTMRYIKDDGSGIMRTGCGYIPLQHDGLAEDEKHPILPHSLSIAQQIPEVTSCWQFYACVDWPVQDQRPLYGGEINARGPFMPRISTHARKRFMNTIGMAARRNIAMRSTR